MTRLTQYISKPIFWATLLITSSYLNAAEPDEYIVELYSTYCQACHSLEATGAPIAFEPSAWEAVLSQGMQVAVNKAIIGAGNMPAQGGCMECGYEDFEELIAYMSQSKAKSN